MVKPGGTGRPALVISAKPAPLPPRTSFILPLPSALPPPNEYTYLVAVFLEVALLLSAIAVSGRVTVAINLLVLSLNRHHTPENQFQWKVKAAALLIRGLI